MFDPSFNKKMYLEKEWEASKECHWSVARGNILYIYNSLSLFVIEIVLKK